MTQVLLLLSSVRGDASLSTKVAKIVADRFVTDRHAALITRDLTASPPPHIDAAYVVGRALTASERSAAEQRAVGIAETLVDELVAADVIVIAASMVNFAPSSGLKAWIDHVVWPGRTMIPTPEGPKGLVTGKKIYIVAASGGIYSSGPMASADFLVPYLKFTLGCIGLTDIETLRIEAQSFGPDAADSRLKDAVKQAEHMALVASV